MKRVMITGAGGFIGRNLTARLIRENIHVYGVDIESAQDRIVVAENVTKISVKIGDTCSEAITSTKPDVIYHLAWDGVSTDAKNNIGKQLANIPLVVGVLDACLKAGCRHIIIPGSASEYAYSGQVIDGKCSAAPGDAYAATKAAAHIFCKWYAGQLGLNLNWPLIGSVYGPGRNDSNILTYTITALLRGEETKYSKLEQMWDYIYIDDLIEALYLLGLHGKPNREYPIGSGDVRPLADYIRQVRAAVAPDALLGIGALPYKMGTKPDNSVPDITNIKNDTGFEPKISFEEGIKKTIAYFREMERSKTP